MAIKNQIAENRKLKEQIERVAKELEQSRKALETCKKDHSNVASRIISAQENERKQMAFELHDVLGKSLTAIKFSIENVLLSISRWGNRETKMQLENVVNMVQETIKETREITTALWPPVLADLGIVSTISWYSREFEKIYPWVFISQKIDVQESQIPDGIKIVIFRIMQEAMNNSIKHSGCKNIEITLEPIYEAPCCSDYSKKTPFENIQNRFKGIMFAITDDGNGFTPSRNNNDLKMQYDTTTFKTNDNLSKFGLLSMKERCRLSGGTLEIESSPDTGTTIKAFWTDINSLESL